MTRGPVVWYVAKDVMGIIFMLYVDCPMKEYGSLLIIILTLKNGLNTEPGGAKT